LTIFAVVGNDYLETILVCYFANNVWLGCYFRRRVEWLCI